MNALTLEGAVRTGRADLVSERLDALNIARLRVLWVAIGFAFLALVAIVRVAYFGFASDGGQARSLSAGLPDRGELTDRNGVPLARAFMAQSLLFNPKAMGDPANPLVRSPQDVARELKAIFPDMDEALTVRRLQRTSSITLRPRVLDEDRERINDLGELALEVPEEPDRNYPQGSMAAHVLGFVNSAGDGRIGMEKVLDAQLKDPAMRGTPIPLSIDIRVQGALEDELRRGMLATNAMGAAGIILDVDTGEVMALASLPEFNPNKIDAAGQQHMFNRVTNQVYELGSTFKPITVAAAIDAGVVRDFGFRWDARPIKVQGRTLRDSHDMGQSLNVAETLIHSSNTTTARIADELGATRMRQTLIDLGMNDRPQIELNEKGFPIWPGDDWSRVRNMTVSYGHGVAVTPLHLASAYAAMVNGGVWRPATLHRLAAEDVPEGRRVFKPSTSSRMRQLLRMIAKYGTGRKADAAGYRVGGKTGSAEKPTKGGYRETSLISTFAAAFPMDDPRFVIVVMLDEPKGTTASSFQRTAAWNAAPIVGKIVPRVGPLMGVMPRTADHDIDLSDLAPLIGETH